MTMFEIYTKEVEIKGEKYRLRPISGRFIKPFFKVIKALNEANKSSASSNEEFLSHLDAESMEEAHVICLEMFKKSYPNEDPAKLEDFVTQNLLLILPAMAEVNLPGTEE